MLKSKLMNWMKEASIILDFRPFEVDRANSRRRNEDGNQRAFNSRFKLTVKIHSFSVYSRRRWVKFEVPPFHAAGDL